MAFVLVDRQPDELRLVDEGDSGRTGLDGRAGWTDGGWPAGVARRAAAVRRARLRRGTRSLLPDGLLLLLLVEAAAPAVVGRAERGKSGGQNLLDRCFEFGRTSDLVFLVILLCENWRRQKEKKQIPKPDLRRSREG